MAAPSPPVTAPDGAVCGLLLAGGRSRRMGGREKALLTVSGKPLLRHVIEAVEPQVASLVLNANGDPLRYAEFGVPVAGDVVEGFAGPLAGVLTGMEWARENVPGCRWVASFPCDAPLVPADLIARLLAAARDAGADMACARSGGRDHPVFGLWPIGLAGELRRAVVAEGLRKVDAWTGRYRLARAEFETSPADPFFNINRPEDLSAAEALMAGR